jgi:hypothetical protein
MCHLIYFILFKCLIDMIIVSSPPLPSCPLLSLPLVWYWGLIPESSCSVSVFEIRLRYVAQTVSKLFFFFFGDVGV